MVHEAVIGFLLAATWITAVSLELIHASKPGFAEEVVTTESTQVPMVMWWFMITWRIVRPCRQFKFLTYQFPTVIVAMTRKGKLGRLIAERESEKNRQHLWKAAGAQITLMQGGSYKTQYRASMSGNWNEYNLNLFLSINWKASLVPRVAVIPDPIYDLYLSCCS